MPLTLAPYAEKITADYLRADPGIAAITRSVVGGTPSKTTDPWIRYTQLDGSAVGDHRADHLIEFYFQIDCFAGETGGQPEANLLARTVRAALVDMPNHSHTAVVTRVIINGMARIPDTEIDEPARERFVITASIWMHN